jgi:uncharacterized coiled-coil protein SlyX
MAELAGSFESYGAWRDGVARAVVELRDWLRESQLLDAEASRRIEVALDRLAEDRLVVAVVAEFSRGKSELINAIFFADCGRRILPTSAGRTTMCPTELMYDPSDPACIRALPIETRARSGNTSDFRKLPEEWRTYPVDTSSAEGMLEAFKLVSETMRVPTELASSYGLFDPDDPDHVAGVDADGTVEISRWRHAVINFPHPLLRQGLVILDTPGLNAIGAEPELTLSLVPSAHAVLFVLAADTGVTKSDLDMWRLVVRDSGAKDSHIAVLNKIDGLWDGLKTGPEVDAEVERQIGVVSHRLELSKERIFAVSAQRGLVAKLTGDRALLAASRLPALEEALVEKLVPAKQTIVRTQTLGLVERVGEEVRQTLAVRERGLVEQLYELRALQGKNKSSIERLLVRARAEAGEFEQVARKVVATRFLVNRTAAQALGLLKREHLRQMAADAKERMRKAWLPSAFAPIVGDYCANLRRRLREADVHVAELSKMIAGVQSGFAQELGWSLAPPMPFGVAAYLAEVDRLQEAAKAQFGTFTVLTHGKWALIERFLETVVAKSRDLLIAVERDVEAWAASLMPPIEARARDQREQLSRRADAVQKIRDAQDSLEGRIDELEQTLAAQRDRLEALKQRLGATRLCARDGATQQTSAGLHDLTGSAVARIDADPPTSLMQRAAA